MRVPLVLASCLALFGMGDAPSFAKGRGGFTIRANHSGGEDVVAAINFDVQTAGSRRSGYGFLNYSAEDHEHARYPHVVLRMQRFTEVVFGKTMVTVRGIGEFHDEPAQIEFRAEDRSPAPDFFHIEVKQNGEVKYHRHSELNVGGIEVKP